VKRRLTLALIGTVLATLVVAGLGTLLLGRVGARSNTERDLRAQAEATVSLLEVRGGFVGPPSTTTTTTPATTTPGNTPATAPSPSTTGDAGSTTTSTLPRRALVQRERLARVRSALNLEDIELVVLGPSGAPNTDLGDPLPAIIDLTPSQIERLRAGETISGSRGNQSWAAAPATQTGQYLPVLALTRPVDPVFGRSVRWFLVASAATILLAALIAFWLGRRLTRPLAEATVATARIAQGDLSVRLPEHPDRSRHDELDELGHSINVMAEAFERSRGLERQFLLSVSHDLRTPLTSIRGYAEAIADGAAPDDRAAAAVILAESRRLERLVRDLLELAKLDSRRFSLNVVAVDLAEVAGDSVAGFRREAEEDGLAIDLLASPGVAAPAYADPDRLAQVIANLVENAIKYAATTIQVRVVADPIAPRVEVSDDGPGIAPEDLPHVFERLYRASHTPRRKETGSGLGLAIAHELTEAMGGTIAARSDPGGGTRMVVTLRPSGRPVVGPPSSPPTP